MIRVVAMIAVVGLAGCTPPQPQAPAKPAPPATVAKGGPDLLTRWRIHLVPGRVAAEYSKSESDAVWGWMECRDRVLVLTERYNDPTWDGPEPVGGVYYDLILRARGGQTLASATALGSVVKGDLEMPFNLPGGMFDIADSQPDVDLVIRNTKTNAETVTDLNAVARDVLMACAQG